MERVADLIAGKFLGSQSGIPSSTAASISASISAPSSSGVSSLTNHSSQNVHLQSLNQQAGTQNLPSQPTAGSAEESNAPPSSISRLLDEHTLDSDSAPNSDPGAGRDDDDRGIDDRYHAELIEECGELESVLLGNIDDSNTELAGSEISPALCSGRAGLSDVPSEVAEGTDADGVIIPQEDLAELWESVVDALGERLDSQIVNAWIRALELSALQLPSSYEGKVIATIVASNRFCCDHVQRNYSEILITVLGKLLSATVKLVFKVQPKPTLSAPTPSLRSGQSHPLQQTQSRSSDQREGVHQSEARRSVNGFKENGGLATKNGLAPRNGSGNTKSGSHTHGNFQESPAAGRSTQSSTSQNSISPNSTSLNSATINSGSQASSSQSSSMQGAFGKSVGRAPLSRPLSIDETNLNPKYNFSNFVVGGCNQFAHALGLRVSENLGSTYNPLFIYGGVGLGKTHLANAIGNSSVRQHKRVLLVSSETFVSELIASLRGNRMDQFKSKFRSLDLLIIDDIQFIIGKERTQEEFFHTFNELYNRHRQIVITSDKTPQELVGLEERLRTRFASGLSVDLQAPDFETRVAILSKKAESESVHLTEEVCRFIAERIDTNVRELEGALNRLCALSSLHRLPINIPLAQEVIKSLITSRRTQEITYELIQQNVAEVFNVSLSDLLGKRRTQNIALARQVAMYIVRRMTGYSYPEIGAFFGGRDHSTVIHANKIIAERMTTEDELRNTVSGIEKRLKG